VQIRPAARLSVLIPICTTFLAPNATEKTAPAVHGNIQYLLRIFLASPSRVSSFHTAAPGPDLQICAHFLSSSAGVTSDAWRSGQKPWQMRIYRASKLSESFSEGGSLSASAPCFQNPIGPERAFER